MSNLSDIFEYNTTILHLTSPSEILTFLSRYNFGAEIEKVVEQMVRMVHEGESRGSL